jgi:hypothetical protein
MILKQKELQLIMITLISNYASGSRQYIFVACHYDVLFLCIHSRLKIIDKNHRMYHF